MDGREESLFIIRRMSDMLRQVRRALLGTRYGGGAPNTQNVANDNTPRSFVCKGGPFLEVLRKPDYGKSTRSCGEYMDKQVTLLHYCAK